MWNKLKDHFAIIFIASIILTAISGFVYLVWCMAGWLGVATLVGSVLFSLLFLWSIVRIATRSSL